MSDMVNKSKLKTVLPETDCLDAEAKERRIISIPRSIVMKNRFILIVAISLILTGCGKEPSKNQNDTGKNVNPLTPVIKPDKNVNEETKEKNALDGKSNYESPIVSDWVPYVEHFVLRGSTPKSHYIVGEKIPVKTEIKNVNNAASEFLENPNSSCHCEIMLLNDKGERVPEEMLGITGETCYQISINPDEIHKKESCLQEKYLPIHNIPVGNYFIVGTAPGWEENPQNKHGTVLFRLPITVINSAK